jgi:caa(3)-type oxidase subunit IV
MAQTEGQQHPISVYFKVWGWLFVLSTLSYMVDYLSFEGYLRWTLILVFMIMKAGLIVTVFMHMKWERLALSYALGLPIMFVLMFVGLMIFESDNTFLQRVIYFAT